LRINLSSYNRLDNRILLPWTRLQETNDCYNTACLHILDCSVLRYCKSYFYRVHRTIQPSTINQNRVLDGWKDHPHNFSKKKKQLNKFKKNNNLRKKLLKSNLPWTFELSYPRVIAYFSNNPHFACEFQQKSSIGLGSRPKTIACKRKLPLFKHFDIIQHF